MTPTNGITLGWLAEMDDEAPSSAGKAENLADGEYEFLVKKAAMKTPPGKAMVILEMGLEVLSAGKHMGQEIQHSLFITDKDSRDRVLKDLATLGFDTPEWTAAGGRPISGELPKVPKVLKGMRFFAKKVTNKREGGKEYHNVYINRRNDAADGRPPRVGAEHLNDRDPDDPFGD